ncbi:hypothetical protein E2C01_060155 [Portunus trituberculatus]|uniref:Uncharacterized protein n=1 Tax=Portunus trituberculatus TaxID=210409 RepID=A0A5B7H4I4_PORTR|nr:hypothetical protein [Portunus trituberculatus]
MSLARALSRSLPLLHPHGRREAVTIAVAHYHDKVGGLLESVSGKCVRPAST